MTSDLFSDPKCDILWAKMSWDLVAVKPIAKKWPKTVCVLTIHTTKKYCNCNHYICKNNFRNHSLQWSQSNLQFHQNYKTLTNSWLKFSKVLKPLFSQLFESWIWLLFKWLKYCSMCLTIVFSQFSVRLQSLLNF